MNQTEQKQFTNQFLLSFALNELFHYTNQITPCFNGPNIIKNYYTHITILKFQN